MVNHIIFDMLCKTIVCLPTKCCIAPPDTCGELLELDKVFHSLMVFVHTKLFGFGFGFSFRVESTKIGFKFLDEEFEVRKPDGIVSAQKCRLKQSNASPFK